MGEQCLAFVVEYGEKQQQNCYFLDEAAMENRNQLNKMTGSSYNEKICLRGKLDSDNLDNFALNEIIFD